MTVEQDPCIGPEVTHQRYASGKLIDKESRWLELSQLTAHSDRDQEVVLAEDGEEDLEAAEEGGREDGLTADADVEGAYSFHRQPFYEMSRNVFDQVTAETWL